MTTPAREEIEREMSVAENELHLATTLIGLQEYRGAISHIYYAVFHAARAVLWSEGHVPKTHRGMAALFWEQLVVPGKADKELHVILIDERQQRELADYHAAAEDFAAEETEQLFANAQRFVEKMKELLKIPRR